MCDTVTAPDICLDGLLVAAQRPRMVGRTEPRQNFSTSNMPVVERWATILNVERQRVPRVLRSITFVLYCCIVLGHSLAAHKEIMKTVRGLNGYWSKCCTGRGRCPRAGTTYYRLTKTQQKTYQKKGGEMHKDQCLMQGLLILTCRVQIATHQASLSSCPLWLLRRPKSVLTCSLIGVPVYATILRRYSVHTAERLARACHRQHSAAVVTTCFSK